MRRTLMLVLASAVAMFALSAAPGKAQADESKRPGGEVRLVHGGSHHSYHRDWDRRDYYRHDHRGAIVVRPAPPVIVVPSRPRYYAPPPPPRHYYHRYGSHDGGFSLFGPNGGFSIRW